jgi:MoxR-like ATPase
MNGWNQWVDALPKDQREALKQTLIEKKLVSPYTNGHGSIPTQDQKKDVELLRPPVQDFIHESPAYADTHGLVDLYNRVAYKHNLLVKGPKGGGKSLSVTHFAAGTSTPQIYLNCSEDTKDKHMVGNFVIRPGSTAGSIESPWVLGALCMAIDVANEYGRCILTLEEINALTPQVQKQLNSLLDFRKSVVVNQLARSFSLREGAFLWVVATMNPSVYGGTYELNEDLRSRWVEVEVDYPDKRQERRIVDTNVPYDGFILDPALDKDQNKKKWDEMVDQCIKLANETRGSSTQYALSSRDVVSLVKLIKDVGLEQALQLMVCKFEGDDRKTVIARVTSNFKGVYPKESWGK